MQIRCKVCDTGYLAPRKKYRLSGPVVAIGYIFLIPSIIGIAICVLMFVTHIAMASNHPSSSAGVDAVVGGFTIALGMMCFVSGLLGWLLIMKKKVLECGQCKASITVS